jgi:transposase, IS5 family
MSRRQHPKGGNQSCLFGLSDHLQHLSANGDRLQELGRIVDFEGLRVILDTALAYADGKKGGRRQLTPQRLKSSG